MISTKNVKSGGDSFVPKNLTPGNAVVKVNGIKLESPPYDSKAYNLILDCEGPNLGESFEGFLIDKNDPSKGHYAGQIGRVRISEYPFADATTPKGNVIVRDEQLLKTIHTFCKATNTTEWFDAQDEKHDTVESLINQLAEDKPFVGKYIRACIAGREYTNKAGYPAFDLYFPRYSKDGLSYESADVEESKSRVVKFNPEVHIKKSKPTEVSSWGGSSSSAGNIADDFVL
jgi:hypothetical protein